jgi:signal transduction histidine kinase
MHKISDFFRGQYDYIYFFYGLSFLFLALICFTIDRRKSRPLPWVLLGFFGLLHGGNEWVDLLHVTYGESRTLALLEPAVLVCSYILLFEFALVGYARLERKILARRWVYLLLLLAIFLGARSGHSGLLAAARIFLGFPSAGLAALVVFKAARTEQEEKQSLYALSAALALYAVFTGLIVPKSDFLFAPLLNFDSFLRVCKIPVQFVRGILALGAAMAIWSYSTVLSDITFKPQVSRPSFKLTKWVIIFTIVALIALGWVFTNYLDYYASIQIIKNTKERRDSPLNQLIKELTVLERAAGSLGRSFLIRNAVLYNKETEKVTPLLENFWKRYDLRGCSLIDDKGVIKWSAGEVTQDGASDKPFIRREYFRDALSGNAGFSLSLGTKYSERVYYVSFPVKDAKGTVAAIVLLSKIIPVTPVLQYRFFSILIVFFVCILTISFFIVLRKRESLIEYIEHANTQLQALDKLKTDFISIVSHELRTPLTAIHNAASILMKGHFNKTPVDPREKELIQIIVKNTQRQTRMVGDLLDVSKIEAGVMPVCLEQADVVALVTDVVHSLKPQAAERKIILEVSKNARSMVIPMDPEHTFRIVTNLLTNAIKYSAEGGKVKVVLRDEFWEVVVSVADTGSGISKDEMGKLFNKFYRTSDAAARQHGGTGLGLVITKGLVEAQGGRIWFESEVGMGSTFYFTLPKTRKKIKPEDAA